MAQQKPETAFPNREHDHAMCIADALDAAEEACRQGGLRFTPLRRQVLEIVWSRHAPIGAYDILDDMNLYTAFLAREEGPNSYMGMLTHARFMGLLAFDNNRDNDMIKFAKETIAFEVTADDRSINCDTDPVRCKTVIQNLVRSETFLATTTFV